MSGDSSDDTEPLPVLRVPADGIPDVIDEPSRLRAAVEELATGLGPVAIDAERASGHRYGQRAFLFQLRRAGAGTFLVDANSLTDLTPLAAALREPEWILHAATQDLPCLAERDIRPTRLFDTELAARLLGMPRVGLASLTEDLLGIGLAKGHGAADWSKRPLPESWRAYAALDVELLAELREILTAQLEQRGRWEWAAEEFAYLTAWTPRPKADPWRRMSGVAKLPDSRSLAIARELWAARERAAEAADKPPSRVMSDAAILAAARTQPTSLQSLRAMREFARHGRRISLWWQAVERAQQLAEAELPPRRVEEIPPPQRSWERRDPVAAARLSAVRAAISQRADELAIPAEVLVSPDPIRALVWHSTGPVPVEEVRRRLTELGVRQWQQQQIADLITDELA